MKREPSKTKLRKSLRQELEENSNIQSGVDLQKQKEYLSIRFIPLFHPIDEDEIDKDEDEKELKSKARDICKILKQRDFECDMDPSANPYVSYVGVLVGFHRHQLTSKMDFRYRDAFYKFFRSALHEAGLKLDVWQGSGFRLPESKCEIPYDIYTVSTREKTSSEETDKAFEEYKETLKELDEQYSSNKTAENKTSGEGESN